MKIKGLGGEAKRVKGQRRSYVKGPGSPNWKGGKYKGPKAFYIYAPEHPHCDCRGYVTEHRLVVEEVLGKFIPAKSIIHHNDRDHFNNHSTNLVLCEDQAYHLFLHNRMRAIEGCGDPNKRFCKRCDEWKPLSEFYSRNGFIHSGRCKKCHCSGDRKNG